MVGLRGAIGGERVPLPSQGSFGQRAVVASRMCLALGEEGWERAKHVLPRTVLPSSLQGGGVDGPLTDAQTGVAQVYRATHGTLPRATLPLVPCSYYKAQVATPLPSLANREQPVLWVPAPPRCPRQLEQLKAGFLV